MTDHATTLSVEALEFLKMLEGSDGGILIRPESCVAPQKNKTEKCCSMETYLKCWKKGDLPFKIIEEENKYRKAVATKDIAKGTFLFGERPVTQVSAAGTKIENAVTCAMGLLSKPCNSALSLIEELCDSTPKGCVTKACSLKKIKKKIGEVSNKDRMFRLVGIYMSNSHSMVATGEALLLKP